MHPPILTYGLFLEEIAIWLINNPTGGNTLVQLLCMRFCRQFQISNTEWVAYVAPGFGLLLFAMSTSRITSWLRSSLFSAVPTRVALIAMRLGAVLWMVLMGVLVYAGYVIYHHISHGQTGDLVELYTNKVLILTIIVAITFNQLLSPSKGN